MVHVFSYSWQGIGDSAQGFANAVLYCALVAKVRQRLLAGCRRCCCCCTIRRRKVSDVANVERIPSQPSSSSLPMKNDNAIGQGNEIYHNMSPSGKDHEKLKPHDDGSRIQELAHTIWESPERRAEAAVSGTVVFNSARCQPYVTSRAHFHIG